LLVGHALRYIYKTESLLVKCSSIRLSRDRKIIHLSFQQE